MIKILTSSYNGFLHPKMRENVLSVISEIGGEIEWDGTSEGTEIAAMRNALAKRAIENGADAIIFWDADIYGLTSSDIVDMIRADVEIYCISYPHKIEGLTQYYVAQTTKGKWIRREERGFCEVDRAGAGLMMIRADVLRAIPEPWFANPPVTEDGKTFAQSDDWYFCDKAIEAGYDVWLITNQNIKHERITIMEKTRAEQIKQRITQLETAAIRASEAIQESVVVLSKVRQEICDISRALIDESTKEQVGTPIQ